MRPKQFTQQPIKFKLLCKKKITFHTEIFIWIFFLHFSNFNKSSVDLSFKMGHFESENYTPNLFKGGASGHQPSHTHTGWLGENRHIGIWRLMRKTFDSNFNWNFFKGIVQISDSLYSISVKSLGITFSKNAKFHCKWKVFGEFCFDFCQR